MLKPALTKPNYNFGYPLLLYLIIPVVVFSRFVKKNVPHASNKQRDTDNYYKYDHKSKFTDLMLGSYHLNFTLAVFTSKLSVSSVHANINELPSFVICGNPDVLFGDTLDIVIGFPAFPF